MLLLREVRSGGSLAPVGRGETLVARASTAVLAAAIGAGAGLWLTHLAGQPQATRLAYLLTGTICAGAATYLLGTPLADGRTALQLRWFGWILMTVPLLIPSTFSLALPIMALLASTLRPLSAQASSPNVVVPN